MSSRASVDLDFSMKADLNCHETARPKLEKGSAAHFLEARLPSFRHSPQGQTRKDARRAGSILGWLPGSNSNLSHKLEPMKCDGNLEQMQREAIKLGRLNSRSTSVGMNTSKTKSRTSSGYDLCVLLMIVCEKLRAICQQMPAYGQGDPAFQTWYSTRKRLCRYRSSHENFDLDITSESANLMLSRSSRPSTFRSAILEK